MKIDRVAVVVNVGKEGAIECARDACRRLDALSARWDALHLTSEELWSMSQGEAPDAVRGADVVITFGGDGTILAISRLVAALGIPVLGVHLGRFGFIAEAHSAEITERVDDLLAGRCTIQERAMVIGEVRRGGEVVHSATGLNDIVISKGAMTRMLQISTSIGEGAPLLYDADGVVVASPTGSTAYALSTGGPILDPTIDALLVAPICPHTLAARPLVVPGRHTIYLSIGADGGEILFMADSTSVFRISTGDQIAVRKAQYCTRLVVFEEGSFYGKVRRRLLWGERVNA